MSRLPLHKGLRSQPEKYDPPGGFANFDVGRTTFASSLSSSSMSSSSAFHRPRGGKRLTPGEIPHVSHDGGRTRYYADRCYLDAPTGLLEYQLSAKSEEHAAEQDVVHCNKCGETIPPHLRALGGKPRHHHNHNHHLRHNQNLQPELEEPPKKSCPRPLFDRAKFINSLDLSAAIIATYTIGDLDHLSMTFPKLFPPPPEDEDEEGEGHGNNRRNVFKRKKRDHVPTLVLHGHKGLKLQRPLKTASQNSQQQTGQLKQSTIETPEDAGKYQVKSPDNSAQSTDKHVEEKGTSPLDAIVIDSDSESEECDNHNEDPKPSSTSSSSFNHGISSDNIHNPNITSNEEIRFTPPLEPPSNKMSEAFATIAPPIRDRPEIQMEFYDTDSEHSGNDEEVRVSNDRNGVAVQHPRVKRCRLDDILPPSRFNPDVSFDSSNSGSDGDDSTGSDAHQTNTKKSRNGVFPTDVFGGEVFFTQILPRWCPPVSKSKKEEERRRSSGSGSVNARSKIIDPVTSLDTDDEVEDTKNGTTKTSGKNGSPSTDNQPPVMKSERGVHHPKYFLLFEKSGYLVVIISTCNLSSQNAVDASWVQRFEPRGLQLNGNGHDFVDMGMPSDFGVVLADFLKKQSNAAEEGGVMLPDLFLRRFVGGLSLDSLTRCYRFEDAQVSLVSTVPGDYSGCLPEKNEEFHPSRAKKRNLTYGPQRVSYILSRILNESHIRAARTTMSSSSGGNGIGLMGGKMEDVVPWLPPSLVSKMDRLVMQPTSFGGTWTRSDMESMVHSYLRPEFKNAKGNRDNSAVVDEGPLGLVDIVWPSSDYFDAMRKRRRELQQKHPNKSVVIKPAKATTRGDCHVFLSSVSFSKLDRSCISRMALFENSQPPQLPFTTASLHFKSICRLLSLDNSTKKQTSSLIASTHKKTPPKTEYLAWFMLSSACLSRGAQGQPTPYRGLESDSMSYANFELGVLFCSRLLGDQQYDRLYTFDPELEGCRCGKGKRWYKDRLRGEILKKEMKQHQAPSFIESVRKVHIPIPYQLRPKPYQQDPDSDFMTYTPYLHEIPDGTGHVGNMKLTPLGQRLAEKTLV